MDPLRDEDSDKKLLFNVKLALVFLVGVATLLASLLPWWIASHLGSRRGLDLISSASSLSAGVVLGALLCHMLPESAESFGDYMDAKYPDGSKLADYPFNGLLCGVVFLILIAVDVLVVRKGADGHGHSHGEAGGHDHISESLSLLQARAKALEMRRLPHEVALELEIDDDEIGAGAPSPSPGFQSSARHNNGYGSNHNDHNNKKGGHHHTKHMQQHRESADSDGSLIEEVEHALATQRTVRAYVFFAALSLHGVFDGLSVGSEDGASAFTSIAVAVLSHKLFDGLALGCALFPLGLATVHRWILLVVCALTTPLGIGIGLAADAAVDSITVKLVNGVFLGAASGSFMFISVTELWPSSISDGRWIPLKLALFVAGFGAMATLAYYI